jgi:tol-pal system protein YbgF
MTQSAQRLWLMGACAAGAALAFIPPAQAQPRLDGPADVNSQQAVPPTNPGELSDNKGINRRLDRDEQTLRDLRQIVLQAKASGAPVTVKDAGPDPAVTELQSKFDDFDQTLRRLNGQVEQLQHSLDDSKTANQDLILRVTKLEGIIQGLQMQGAGGQPGNQPPPPPQGSLGQLPAGGGADQASADQSGEPGPADEVQSYRQARQVLDGGDYAGGARALQDYLGRYPASPRAPEANYWLGRALSVQNLPPDAAAAYARALKGWPQSPWAGDAVIRLSVALVDMKRTDDACAALGEFDRRYSAKAAVAVKARARDARGRAACS